MNAVPGTGMHRDFPYTTRPTGWFQLGWSPDFPTGTTVPLHFFGTDLAAYRGESGKIRLVDAHCPHLGAHLGHGGVVTGDDLACPFHGWRFDGETGKNVDIPYSARGCFPGVSLRTWEVHEHAGVVYFWHDSNGLPAQWAPPRPIESADAYFPVHPEGVRSWKLRLFPQFIPENGVDYSHFHFAHRAATMPALGSFGAEGHIFRTRIDMTFGGHADSTWLTPDGPVESQLETELQGVGINVARFHGTDGTTSLVGVTPIDDEYSLFSMTNWIERTEGWSEGDELPEVVRRRFAEQYKQAGRDQVIWENMRYRRRPPLVPEERAGYVAVRDWAKTFYPGTPEYEARVREPATRAVEPAAVSV
jgi:phenylpropionate dioxygenase-like ring-hydroxylating dioxygenase large terminal subunit